MVRALGVSLNAFQPDDPGRLCRGRERWIEPWEPEGWQPPLTRLVVGGAAFSDDSARDARRGLHHAGVDVAALLDALFPGATWLAFMEDGHPADIPDQAEGVEAYEGWRAGGLISLGLARWHQRVLGAAQIRAVAGSADEDKRVSGFLLLQEGQDEEALMELAFGLVGMSSLDSPPARYNPMALPELLAEVPAVALVHRDKQGSALGIYLREPLAWEEALAPVAEAAGSLLVPFAVPPMLARWDRALSDLRAGWSAEDGDFPVPPATEAAPPGVDESVLEAMEELPLLLPDVDDGAPQEE
jgi:hypothetical protein